MEDQIEKFRKAGENIMLYGKEIIAALAILVFGLIAIKLFMKYFRRTLQKFTTNQSVISIVSTSLHVVLVVLVVAIALHYVGVPTLIIRRILVATILAVVGLMVIFRPYIPSLPYKVGNTIEVGGLVGKVEATTLINTRLRTFDGKTLFVPYRMIINDIVNNYHFTPNRQIRIYVTISYGDDLLRAKQLISEIIAGDSRVHEKPAPNVFVTNLGENGVALSARGWVQNVKYLRARSDILEKIMLRFDEEGITIARPRLQVYSNNKSALPILAEDANIASKKSQRTPSGIKTK